MASQNIDYYKTLEISPQATQQQIREAYKKAALKHHPDRVPANSPERASRTRRFQQINDAYYTLSDATRRRDYDAVRSFHSYGSGSASGAFADDPEEEIPTGSSSSAGGQSWSSFASSFFGGGGARASSSGEEKKEEQRSNAQFSSVFEEMMRDEGMAEGTEAKPTGKFWSFVGGLSGAAMGFIVANFPGAVAGGVAGNRLGAVRDAKGKSVYAVFQELPQSEKAQLLSSLAAKVFAHAVSG